MNLSLSPGQRFGILAVFVVCVLVNAALYLTVSFTQTSGATVQRHLHSNPHSNRRSVRLSDIRRTGETRKRAPEWVKNSGLNLDIKSLTPGTDEPGLQTGFKLHLNGNEVSATSFLRRDIKDPSLPAIKTMAATGKHDSPASSSHKDGHPKSHDFDAVQVLHLFESCKEENGEILIDCYNDAYEELCKLFKLFGAVFGFVTSDVVEKIGILREYRKGENGQQFRTVQGMIKYEVDNKLTIQKNKASGCRTLLRLHRALEFIAALLVKIRDTDNHSKFSHEGKVAYDDTLAKHHPWLIKKAVHVALHVLPTRQHLLEKMKVEDTPAGMEQINRLIQQLQDIYDITQDLYAKNELLDLP